MAYQYSIQTKKMQLKRDNASNLIEVSNNSYVVHLQSMKHFQCDQEVDKYSISVDSLQASDMVGNF